MFYKPNYCCNCGEKIERIEWYPWTNRRFCEICQTEYQLDDWIKRIFPTLFLIFGILGIGIYLKGNDKRTDIYEDVRTMPAKTGKKIKTKKPKTLLESNIKRKELNDKEWQSPKSVDGTKPTFEPLVKDTKTNELQKKVVIAKSKQNDVKQNVYYCGAKTKKGTPCSRKVKGGGRCWQHEGRKPILSDDELKVLGN